MSTIVAGSERSFFYVAAAADLPAQPRRGINFGPVAFNADAMSKTFELKNEGEFEFVFVVQVRSCQNDAMLATF